MGTSATHTSSVAAAKRPMTSNEKKIIFASSLGTVFEWYDFYLYGSLAVVIGAKFFGQFDETTRNIFALLAFAAGFLVRPFGALVFGRIGDLVGRKYTFLVTILIMGSSTFIVGVLPTSQSIGITAAIILISLRILQGLALGGEYGGAATYVAEHAPAGRRGFYTSWIQTTATLGLFLSLLVILSTQSSMSSADFQAWGWRIPFLVSIILLGVSVWIRLQLSESPAFLKMKAEGRHSKAPLSEAFGQWANAKWAILALLGLVAGQAVVWYSGQFYALFFLTSTLKVDGYTGNLLVAWSLAIGSGGFILFGWLSDKIGRKPIILGGCILAALTYFPTFRYIADTANPALSHAHESVKVVVVADPNDCSFQFNPTGLSKFTTSCDIAKGSLSRASVTYSQEDAAAGTPASVKIGDKTLDPKTGTFAKDLADALTAVGYPAAANPSVVKMANPFDIFRPQPFTLVLILAYLVVLVTMVYGPIAAALVELFPTRIRYTSMSLPYHIGNGWFGGLLPATVFAMNAQSGSLYFGLWYPVAIAAGTAVIGLLFLPETKDRDIFAGDSSVHPGDTVVEFDPNAADY
ncbi:MAG TPA: MFS transporter [Rhodopila sp.]|uniref:MFS transporter n=1 Tax=Rhodopila sp. TaxID=2480087 RepID=UPI002BD6B76E|nr:MFS transporter [Rhodopila sp.]HVY15249.1 MFS transporter [Rhodopila sp.]